MCHILRSVWTVYKFGYVRSLRDEADSCVFLRLLASADIDGRTSAGEQSTELVGVLRADTDDVHRLVVTASQGVPVVVESAVILDGTRCPQIGAKHVVVLRAWCGCSCLVACSKVGSDPVDDERGWRANHRGKTALTLITLPKALQTLASPSSVRHVLRSK